MTKLSKAEIGALDSHTMCDVVEAATVRLRGWKARPEKHRLQAEAASRILMAQLSALAFVEYAKARRARESMEGET